MKNGNNVLRFLVLVLFIGLSFSSCQEEKVTAIANNESPNIDFNAIILEDPKSTGQVQVLLKISLDNYTGDLIKYGISKPEIHQNRLKYFISDFKKEITLVSGDKQIECIDSHMERLHMDLPYRNFILTFLHKEFKEGDYLKINDHIYSNKTIELTIQNQYE